MKKQNFKKLITFKRPHETDICILNYVIENGNEKNIELVCMKQHCRAVNFCGDMFTIV